MAEYITIENFGKLFSALDLAEIVWPYLSDLNPILALLPDWFWSGTTLMGAWPFTVAAFFHFWMAEISEFWENEDYNLSLYYS